MHVIHPAVPEFIFKPTAGEIEPGIIEIIILSIGPKTSDKGGEVVK
jgi:hypothetical protein